MLKVFLVFTLLSLASYAEQSFKRGLFVDDKGVLQYGTYNPNKNHKADEDSYAVSVRKYITANNRSQGSEKIKKTAIIPEVESLVTTMVLKAGQIVLNKENKPVLIEAVFQNGKVVVQPLEINPVNRHRLKGINEYFAPISNANMAILDQADIIGTHESTCSKDNQFCRGQEVSEINGVSVCEKLNKCYSNRKAYINGVFSNGALLINNTLFPPEELSKKVHTETIDGEVSP